MSGPTARDFDPHLPTLRSSQPNIAQPNKRPFAMGHPADETRLLRAALVL